MSETDVKGTMLGYDGHGMTVYVGSFVEHLEKVGFGIGRVTTGGLFYKDEVACKVDFEHKADWTARLSKIKVVPEPVKKQTLADFGYKVGDKVHQVKYNLDLTITSGEVGTYRNEPCCYTDGGRPTRFSQIQPFVEPVAPKVDLAFEEFLKAFEAPKCPILKITLPNGKIVTIEVE